MTDRILFSAGGVKVSRVGVDVNTAPNSELLMYPGMSTMTVAVEDTVLIAGGSRANYSFLNPSGRMPYVILSSTSGDPADRETFCAETSPPYTSVAIRNDVQSGAPTREIRFSVLIDNDYI